MVAVSVYLCAFAACALGCSSCELVVTTSKAYSSSCNQEYNEVEVEENFKPNGLKQQHTLKYSTLQSVYYLLTVYMGNSSNKNDADQVTSGIPLDVLRFKAVRGT